MDMEGLSMICVGLGTVTEDDDGNRIGYAKGDYCLDNLKDLLRFLRRDDPQTRDVFKQVCKWKIVSEHLIPIIQSCQEDRNLVLNAVKVLVFITMPIGPTSTDISKQLEHLWGLKSSITCSDIIPVIVTFLENPLENLESGAFTEDDWKVVQLILTLFRNVLAVQEIPLQQKSGGSSSQLISLRDRFLELLFQENVMDIILVLTQRAGGSCGYLHQDNLLLLEMFHYIFMGQDPSLIVRAHLKGSELDADSQGSLSSLKSIVEEEEKKRRMCRLNNMSRHSQFSGTFARFTMDGSKAVFKGDPASAPHTKLIKSNKVCQGVSKRIAWDHQKLPTTGDELLKLLYGFMNQFLSGGYNVLMQYVSEDIEKEHPSIQKSDVVIFFEVAKFVISFQYHKCTSSKLKNEADNQRSFDEDISCFSGAICGPVAATMNESMFQLVVQQWRDAFDGLKETNDYTFLSSAGSLMKIMIQMLDLVLKLLPEDSKEPLTARILLYKLFYDQTDQGMTRFLLNSIKLFDTHKQPKSDLSDLVEIVHKVVKLMEKLQARGTLRVSKKSRKVRKKKILEGTEPEKKLSDNRVPIHNKVDIPSGEQYQDMQLAQDKSSGEEEDTGFTAHTDEKEFLVQQEANNQDNLSPKNKKNSTHGVDDGWGTIGDISDDEHITATDEVDFNVSTLISAFANSSIIQKLCWLLKFYKTNSPRTNYYIICMLQRITDELELQPMLYQLSLLTIFYDILVEQKSCPLKEYKNVVDFLTRLVRNMLKKMKNQPLLFVEILFWKTRKECHYITAEYLLHELGHLRKESGNWGNMHAEGDLGSLATQGWTRRSIADALGEDEADVVITHDQGYEDNEGIASVSDSEKDRKYNDDNQIAEEGFSAERVTTLNKSIDLEGSQFGQHLHKRKRVRAFNEDEEAQIRSLYEQFKDQRRCCYLIAKALDPDGKIKPAQISRKLKKLGLSLPSNRVKSDMQLRDEDLDDSLANTADDSNDETLLSLVNRNKKKNKRQLSEECPLKTDKGMVEVDSDDEFPSSIIKKPRESRPNSRKKPPTLPIQSAVADKDSVKVAKKDVLESNQSSVSELLEINDFAPNGADVNNKPKDEEIGIGRKNRSGITRIVHSEDQIVDDELADALADSGDEVQLPASYSPDNAVPRRKPRMVIDSEEDD